MSNNLYKQGPNGYALYFAKGDWRESASVRNDQLKPIKEAMIGITGTLNHGKNTLASLIQSRLVDTKRKEMAFGDAPKAMLQTVFPKWTSAHFHARGLKEVICPIYGISPRAAMTTFATGFMRNSLGLSRHWINLVEEDMETLDRKPEDVIITDVRFNNEAAWVKSNDGFIIRIRDPRKLIPTEEESEQGISAMFVDYVIENDGSIDDIVDKLLILKPLYYLPKSFPEDESRIFPQ